MQTDINFWSYLDQFFLEWKLFQTTFAEKNKNHDSLPKNRRFLDITWGKKNIYGRQATNNNMAHANFNSG